MSHGTPTGVDSLPRAHYCLGGYREHPAPAPLRAFAEGVWIHRTEGGAWTNRAATHRVLPDPALSLAFTCFRDEVGTPYDARVIVVGPVTAVRAFALQPGFEMVAVKLKLEWVEPLLGLAPPEYENQLADLIPPLPGFGDPLTDRLVATRSAAEAASLLVAAVEERVRSARRWNPTATHRALDLIRRTGGRLPMDAVSRQLGIPGRTLRRGVRREAGVSLKTYARTIRFLRTVTATDHLSNPHWARVAAEAGYCDQSHFVRECRTFAGLSPDRLFRERRAEAELSNPR